MKDRRPGSASTGFREGTAAAVPSSFAAAAHRFAMSVATDARSGPGWQMRRAPAPKLFLMKLIQKLIYAGFAAAALASASLPAISGPALDLHFDLALRK